MQPRFPDLLVRSEFARLPALILVFVWLGCPSATARAEIPPHYVLSWGVSSGPSGIDEDAQGYVYTIDIHGGVHKTTNAGVEVLHFVVPGWRQVTNAPVGLAVAPSGHIFVADQRNRRIDEFDASGALVATFGDVGTPSQLLVEPRGIAIGAGGILYVVDLIPHLVRRYGPDHAYLGEFGAAVLTNPMGVDVSPQGEVYVACHDGLVTKFSASGTLLQTIGHVGIDPGSFNGLVNLDVDAAGNLFTIDGVRAQKFDSSGRWLSQWGSAGAGAGQFGFPIDIVVDPTGDSYICDTSITNNYRVSRFAPCGPGCLPRPSGAGDPKILLHLTSATSKNACAAGQLADCRNATTRGGLSSQAGPYYYAYLLAAPRSIGTISGLQCGINYQNGQSADLADGVGVDIFSWTLCAALQFPTPGGHQWPRPGGGNIITWDSSTACQSGPTAVAGYFYLAAYSPDRLEITPRPIDGYARVADCQSIEFVVAPNGLGAIVFSTGAAMPGCNPCVTLDCNLPLPVVSTSWSAIKGLFAR